MMSEQYTLTDPPPPYSPRREPPSQSADPQPVDPQPAIPQSITSEPANLSIHPSPTHDGVIVRVQPPEGPNAPQPDHIPCDIVLVIDVSASMDALATAKINGEDEGMTSEGYGFSILDVTKHAACTILSTLDERDRLGIVVFDDDARIVQELRPMNTYNKQLAEWKIRRLKTGGWTNLWDGITTGIHLFDGQRDTGRVPAIMILTDGLPNLRNPSKGFVVKLRESYETLPATIHTFGFGYKLESGLLKSIAEVGSGNFAFIPDPNMIGTVFIHAVAHLQSTFATRGTLELTTSKGIRLRTTAGTTIEWRKHADMDAGLITINLGNLQYGQSRDIYLEIDGQSDIEAASDAAEGSSTITAELTYSQMTAEEHHIHREERVFGESTLSESEFAYHKSRSMICSFFSSIFPPQGNEEYTTVRYGPQNHQEAFEWLLGHIPAKDYNDQQNVSLIQDLDGQVRLALSKYNYFETWGCHYFFSLWNAHAKQLRNSFKDHGPLMYNENAYFIKQRDALDDAFNNIPAPAQTHAQAATTRRENISMHSLNRPTNPCFTGSSRVTLASGRQVPVRELRRGVSVRTPTGSRLVSAMLKTMVRGVAMRKVGDLVVTPWHPVKVVDDGAAAAEWAFPAELEQLQVVLYSGPIYSVLLQPDGDVESHALQFGGVWAVTLGHGLVRGDDVRAHRFLGHYGKVKRAIMGLRPGKNGVALSSEVKRRSRDGLVSGFRKHVPQRHSKTGCRTGVC